MYHRKTHFFTAADLARVAEAIGAQEKAEPVNFIALIIAAIVAILRKYLTRIAPWDFAKVFYNFLDNAVSVLIDSPYVDDGLLINMIYNIGDRLRYNFVKVERRK